MAEDSFAMCAVDKVFSNEDNTEENTVSHMKAILDITIQSE